MASAFDGVRSTSPVAGAPGRSTGAGRSGAALPPARAADVETLISRAERHALGLDFLVRGAPDAVAMTFGVHAFVVDAARDHLRTVGRAG